ncbi:hypothetical protein HDV06_003914 [Boothiomyces sp. JEL0866]|nr:hypothetical protein HDV06_003914 [Boothiomyces sp. JEL0866]
MTNKQQLLKDDDEFQEFDIQDWNVDQKETIDSKLWIEDWDNDSFEDPFSLQLRAELLKYQEKQKSAQ